MDREATVVIVAARVAYEEYLEFGAYVCQPRRALRPDATHMGFYAGGAVQPEVARIRWARDEVLFSAEEAVLLRGTGRAQDDELAALMDALLAVGPRQSGQLFKVVMLALPDAVSSVVLAQPVPTGEVDHRGRPAPFTQQQRYVRLDDLVVAALRGQDTTALASGAVRDATPAGSGQPPVAGAASTPLGDALPAQVRRLCEALAEDPVFAASLGSKELFHSNMLGWYLDRHPAVADAVLTAWTGAPAPSTLTVYREWRHLDLVVEGPDGTLAVVENKTFSLARDEQLADYGPVIDAACPGEPALVLLSIVPPPWPGPRRTLGGKTWTHHSYGELGVALARAVPTVRRFWPRSVSTARWPGCEPSGWPGSSPPRASTCRGISWRSTRD